MGLTVSLRNDKTTIAEMVDSGEIGHIAEMISDPVKLDNFHSGWGAKGAALAEAAKDTEEHPVKFIVARVEEGWSRSKRLYSGAFLDNLAEQVNELEPVGHLGHIEDDKESTAFPDPQTTWFGAFTKQELSQQKDRVGEMVRAIYCAGYNLPGAKVRMLIPARAVRGVSWWGRGEQVPVPGKGVEVRGFTLKALDWARKLAEGMPTSGVVAIASEMEDTTVGDKALAQVTPEEFKKENPNGYALLVGEAVAEKDAKISEMEDDLTEAKKSVDLLAEVRKALKIKDDADPLAAIADAMSKLGAKARETLDAALEAVLAEKVPDEQKRALVKRLLPVGEMESKLADTKEEDAQKVIGEMVDKSFNDDELVKNVIGEMTAPAIRRREEVKGGSAGTQDNPYIVGRERVTLS